ncbi:MAG: hypothetical protein ACK48V_02675 [Crocinitomicaceae bacterium]|jgi:hypothetical protein
MKRNKKNIIESITTFKELNTNPLEYMYSTKFKRSELNLDARIANHWYDKGLFPRQYDDGSWFIFNLPEAFWVKIMMRLRGFNIPLETLKNLKDNLFDEAKNVFKVEQKVEIINQIKALGLIDDNNINEISENKEIWDQLFKIKLTDFEQMIQSIILERKNYFMLLNLEGKTIIGNYEDLDNVKNEEYLDRYKKIVTKSHVHLSMNEILSDLVKTLGYSICTEKIPIFTKKEIETLELIEKISDFTLDFRKKAPHQYETIRVDENNINEIKTMIYELILEKNYQNIVIHPLYGKFHHLEVNA